MRVGIFGGTGFVGSYIVDRLLAADMQTVLLVRPGHGDRVTQADRVIVVQGDVGDADAIDRVIGQVDAVIYNIGILREFPARGVTFDGLQAEAPCRIIDAAQRLGVRRFLLMSANGVHAGGTAYQRSKVRAERCLFESTLDGTVFRPSVVFGDPRGRMEFATQLVRDIVKPPVPAPLFFRGLSPASAGAFRLSPVHVEDVAETFVRALQAPETIGQTLDLGGPAKLTWREIIQTLAAAIGVRKFAVPVPAAGVMAAACLFDRFEAFPLTRDQLQMLLEGNTCEPAAIQALGITPRAFDTAHLGYLRQATGCGD